MSIVLKEARQTQAVNVTKGLLKKKPRKDLPRY